MAQITFDHRKLDKIRYDINNPLDAARFQQNVIEFMDLVRNTVVGELSDRSNDANRQLVDKFCKFVDDKEVWHLAQMVVPEFRSSLMEQDYDYLDKAGEFALLNNVLEKLSSLPARRDDENILVEEGDMIRQRHERFVEYLVTRGKGRNGMTPEERAESDQRIREVEAAIATTSVRDESPVAGIQGDEEKEGQAVSKTKAQSKDSKTGKGKGKGKGKEKEKGKGKEKEK